MGRPRVRTPELRAHFVSVGIRTVADRGVGGLTTRRVAAEAGSSLAALNELFGGKDGLVGAIALEGFARLELALAAAPGHDDPRRQLLAAGRAFHDFVVEHPRLAELMFSRPFAGFDPDDAAVEAARSIRLAFTSPMAGLVGDGPSSEPSNELSTGSADDLAVGLVALVEGLARQDLAGLLGSTPTSARRRFDAAVETYLAGAGAGAGRR